MSPASASDQIQTASNAALVRTENLSKEFPAGSAGILGAKAQSVKAVAGVNLEIQPGETLGLVGESGSGKSTLGRLILKLLEPTAGRVFFDGRDLSTLGRAELRALRRQMQLVFQDPYASLNPRMRVRSIVGEGIEIHKLARGAEKERRIAELLAMVGMSADAMDRRPHEFSGGQRQRIGIARALAVNPRFLVLDEPVSALDVSIRAQILNLLRDLQARLGLSYLFIAHDLAAVAHMSHTIVVMYLGKIVESGEARGLARAPMHPYTEALFSAALPSHPDERREEIILPGEVPSPLNPPAGCHFHPRCPHAMPRCAREEPPLGEVEGRLVACHLYGATAPGEGAARRVTLVS
ncbi:MAG TPA: oligopeptide/dipeptide ABC transporter ATP-binding protein [Stellaceae bacterium]|nr:oligopeptide/dipeptide ABC transporter ATP-binding protein [Stellaceae bacterium]